MNRFHKIKKTAGYSKEQAANEPVKELSPIRVRFMGVIKLVSSVSVCKALLINANISIGLLILPLIFSFKYIPEITSGKIFPRTTAREWSVPILLVVSFLLVVVIAFFVWLGAEAEKTGNSKNTPAAIPQQLTQ